ncbi:glycosyltransferase family 1 protein [Siminovitchia acidinfaciens]|uniref:Glycosyltransferase family 1 protein n=1 Tax=Siminovitchia acidinfaciens TaxID=2321395 RepID=A0A429XW76_9BACI|nr:glycosyltransferase family 1 protein [Siminovitchia acidinfaciens]RST72545.1 glycosyltransferase family 1 protein [Siminovitchia acidinfaciens]
MGGPLRVLHVVVNMNRGGAETLIMNLYRNIDRSKVQFDFLTCRAGVFDEEISTMGGRIHRIPYISDVGHFKYIKALTQFFSEQDHYEIVHSHLDKMSGVVLRAAKNAGVPVRISHSHNTQSEGGIATRTYKWLAGTLIPRNSTTFFACSTEAAKWLFNGKSQTAQILKNGIEYEKFAFSHEVRKQVRDELQLNNKHYVLGHVGRFSLQKNHSFLIDVFAKYSKMNDHAVLLLIGDGPLRKEMEEKVRTLYLEKKVFFLGVRSDINRVLQGLDLFVFPSLHEGLPVSLMEAQGADLPCLISDRISKEVDLGVHLVHYASLEDTVEWAEQIKKISNKCISKTNVPAALTAQGYDITATANQIEDFYLSVSG